MTDHLPNEVSHISHQISGLSIPQALHLFAERFPGRVVFSSSFSLEDQLITDIILSNHLPINIFTLDTGRLFPETYSAWNSTNEKYAARIKPYFPDRTLLEKF